MVYGDGYDMLSFQVENIELFPEEYMNNELLASRMTNTRKRFIDIIKTRRVLVI